LNCIDIAMNAQLPIPLTDLQAFCRAHSVRELSVFGSAVRGDFGANSDVDVLIELATEARVGLIALQRMRDELARIFGRPVDLLTKNGINRHIRADILREAQVIHAE
jgi:predicted nucleotidyltransferase